MESSVLYHGYSGSQHFGSCQQSHFFIELEKGSLFGSFVGGSVVIFHHINLSQTSW
jgi:hypothetical protein